MGDVIIAFLRQLWRRHKVKAAEQSDQIGYSRVFLNGEPQSGQLGAVSPASAKSVERRPFERGFRPYTPDSSKNGFASYLLRGEVRLIRAGRVCDLLSSELRASAPPREILENRSENSLVS